MMTGVTAQPVQSGLQVVHAMPGRVRLRAASSSLVGIESWEAQLDAVAKRLRQEDGVCNVHTHLETGSLVVRFDENTLSYSQLFQVLRRCGVSIAPELQPTENQTDSLWIDSTQIESVIPLIAGALITGGLGIQGLPAIPVYLLAAGTTRQLMEQFEEEFGWLSFPSSEREAGLKSTRLQPEIEITEESDSLELKVQSSTSGSERINYSVVHAVPGRLRFQISRLAQDEVYARRLEKIAEADSQIISVRVNAAAASVVFSYPARAVSETKMRSHLINLIQQAGEAFKPIAFNSRGIGKTGKSNIPVPTRPPAHPPTCPPAPEKITFLTGLKPPALAMILNFMVNLC